MNYRIVISPRARADGLNAAQFIAREGSRTASSKWFEAMVAAMNSLSTMPLRCGRAREASLFPEADLRQHVFMSHRIVFRVHGSEVHILRLLHVSQDSIPSEDFGLDN